MKEELRLHYDRKDHMHKYVESNNRVLTEKDELIKRLIEKVGNLSVKFQYLKDDGIASEYVDDDDNFDNSDDDGDDEPLVLAGDTMKQFNNVQDYVKSQYKACKSYPELQMDFY